ncbi:MAG: hypothetical protein JWO31_4286 [Phycisphaerales bacterium]|nr:hypothetical protein [Phycisphaerales bacterium]
MSESALYPDVPPPHRRPVTPDRKPRPEPGRPNVFRVPLNTGHALIDASDAERVGRFLWSYARPTRGLSAGFAHRQYYRDGRFRTLMLGRFVLRAAQDERVEYLDGDMLNCTRANLRRVPRSDPTPGRARKSRTRKTSSEFKGVSLYRRQGTWKADIRVNQRTVHLGTFRSEVAAAVAYDHAAREHFGPDARINFPEPSQRA